MLCPLHFFTDYFKDLNNQGDHYLMSLNLHFIVGKVKNKITDLMRLLCSLNKTTVMKVKAIRYTS